jgi:hypothetical protein
MNYKIIKLDRRYAYYKEFAYMVEFHRSPEWAIGARSGAGSGVLDFDRVRKWMNESWGWSQDVETRKEMIRVHGTGRTDATEVNRRWAWSCRYQEYRIYMDESALTLFRLKWSNNAPA